ncbi:cation transporter [Saccharopolyspora spinosa]|uniref:cation transporter n=1 Tax=Saccharopolyspora spinosa TaxID=60894 RepID=UPI0002379F5D|nr:heavy metal-associated domain-containing protein [Saccharopolyspora spinosa]
MSSISLHADDTTSREVEFSVDGMTCASCSARVERKLNKLDGVHANVNYATGRARVLAPAEVDNRMLVDTVEKAVTGPKSFPPLRMPRRRRNPTTRSGTCGGGSWCRCGCSSRCATFPSCSR